MEVCFEMTPFVRWVFILIVVYGTGATVFLVTRSLIGRIKQSKTNPTTEE